MGFTDHIPLPATLSESVRSLALERGISERTAWRWAARLRTDGHLPERGRRCDRCGRPLPGNATARRRFCRDSCRVQANRQQPVTKTPQKEAAVCLDEAAYLLNVSSRLLTATLPHLPLAVRRDSNSYRLPRAQLTNLFNGQRALPLVQAALAQAATKREDANALAHLATNNTAALRHAHRQAHALTRLTRAAKAPHKQHWQNTERLLQTAIHITLLKQGRWPTRAHYQQLARDLDHDARSLTAFARTLQQHGDWDDQWNEQLTLAAAAPNLVRAYLNQTRRHQPSTGRQPTDPDTLWKQATQATALNADDIPARTALRKVAEILNKPENLHQPQTTAARQIAHWLTDLTDQPRAQAQAGKDGRQ